MLTPLGKNVTELNFADSCVLFSYMTPVAIIECRKGRKRYYKTEEKWSQTTSKHINKWFARHGVSARVAVEKPQAFINKLASFTRLASDAIETA